MSHPRAESRTVLPRAFGAALTGAVLAYGAVQFFSWVKHHKDQVCEKTDGLCWTWWDWAAVPLAVTTALIVLMVVYKRLDIGPRLGVILPTILIAPFPLLAAQTTVGWWAATITGGAWSFFLILATWSRYRILGLTASAALLLVSLVVLYT
ncbi:hypothetical protein ABT084_05850 [Streptomyces sp. NPDC002138]|uniref:hypothetical protein n=1 Tax=Streptomyces sp. NPDC002138 TaxID=3154410 RepID=UPI003324370E